MAKKDRFFGAHETFDREEHVKASSDRAFGLVMAGVFLLIGALTWFSGSAHWIWWLLAALLFALPAVAYPRLLAPLNRLWLKFGLLLNSIVSPVVLALLFYACITPIGFVMRLAGKDPLRLRWDANATSYWIAREPPGPLPGSFKNQY